VTRNIIADMHTHSTASDGEYSPSELVYEIKNLGLKAVSLTDHDNIEGLEEAIQAGGKAGIDVIPGVEVSLRFRRRLFTGSLHLLLYFDSGLVRDKSFRKNLEDILSMGRGPSLVRERIKSINMEFGPGGKQPILSRTLSLDDIKMHGRNITRRHFAIALKEGHGIDNSETVNTIIGNNSPAYIPSGIEMNTLTPFLKKFPVVSVLAHPAAGSFPPPSFYREVLPPVETVESMLPEFMDPEIIGIDGLEVHYPGHTQEHRKTLIKWAGQYNLIITGGSDCHDKIDRPLGADGMIDEELEALNERIKWKNSRTVRR